MVNADSKAGDALSPPLRVVVLLPVYNDWECAGTLLRKLDAVLAPAPVTVQVVFVDDGSETPIPPGLVGGELGRITRVESLRLRRNLGHQRAISIGLCFVFEQRPCDAVVVMDADGEDRPEDVLRLLEAFRECGGNRVIFAQRARRAEGWRFRLGYRVYRGLHRLLTGIPVRVGNFSVVPFSTLATLVVVSETWNHYAASVFKARLPRTLVPTERGVRLHGRSRFNFVGLVIHGLAGISVHAEIVGVRLMMAFLGLGGLALAAALTVVGVRLGTTLAIPGWATNALGLLLVLLLQMLTVVAGLTGAVLFSRNTLGYLPIRDYRYFLGPPQCVYERAG